MNDLELLMETVLNDLELLMETVPNILKRMGPFLLMYVIVRIIKLKALGKSILSNVSEQEKIVDIDSDAELISEKILTESNYVPNQVYEDFVMNYPKK